MTLDVEDYVFAMADNHRALLEYMKSLGPHRWDVDVKEATLRLTRTKRGLFGRQARGEVLVEWPIQMIGTHSVADNTWLWSWSNPGYTEEYIALQGVIAVRNEAARQGKEIFCAPGVIPIPDEYFTSVVGIVCAGYLGGFAPLSLPYDRGKATAVVMRCPEIQDVARDPIELPMRTARALTTDMPHIPFNHRRAVLAYLGEPQDEPITEICWIAGSGFVNVVFDDQDRIDCVEIGVWKEE
jgi:hypothetical protein